MCFGTGLSIQVGLNGGGFFCVSLHLNQSVHTISNAKGATNLMLHENFSRILSKTFYTSSDLEIFKTYPIIYVTQNQILNQNNLLIEVLNNVISNLKAKCKGSILPIIQVTGVYAGPAPDEALAGETLVWAWPPTAIT